MGQQKGRREEVGEKKIFTIQKSGRYVLHMQKYIPVTSNLMFFIWGISNPAVRHVV